MIKYEWRDGFDESEAAELRGLLERAAAYDAEPEYNTIDPDDVLARTAEPDHVRNLVIWMLPRPNTLDGPPDPERIAGMIRFVDRGEQWWDATVVIDPDLRSIGIMTLLLEQAGLNLAAEEGWLGSGIHRVQAWARGNHPASGRIGDRNLIPRTRRVWKLIRPHDGTESERSLDALSVEDAPDVLVYADRLESGGQAAEARALAGTLGGDGIQRQVLALRKDGQICGLVDLGLVALDSEEYGRCAPVRHLSTQTRDRAEITAVLLGAASVASNAGLHAIQIHVESTDDDLVGVCRLLGFQHDRTDVRYELR
ncbi:putative acetyltransferase [Gordonia polyisoprenivorans NBRC 16320 = JCM 10675]|uniref:N-acetyltransferase n=1 Tax=Gordonia polyisoprenivorans TaxID=84595 RepID=A0A846WI38_9ACTN|nr:N-acetyltransferase [Gordonia polyisoprenivorans]NKY01402.1 N-acetyltransferase [Gordonia polyisoprenivorans]GAB26281.1 putative acetyltransferase [Gordonia polyisoprenivorans NBRC 16320 = JCM 10675]